MISVVMLALAAGYSFGGWIADRKPTDTVVYFIVLGRGAYQLLIVFVVRSVLLKLWQMEVKEMTRKMLLESEKS